MAKPDTELNVTQSLAERLVDLEPRVSADASVSRSQSVRQMKAFLRRDLEWLLNTRRIADIPQEGPEEINRSMLVYGLPDLSALSMATAADRARLTRQVAAAIAIFEPRLAAVRVSLVESSEPSRKDVRMRIEAMLRMDPVPEPISFDTTLQLATGEYQIRGDRGA